MVDKRKNKAKNKQGRLRIGNQWNAITIIALSQSNPLKAIAEFVENSIDAQAHKVTIIRGKEKNQQYLKIIDDGEGLPCSEGGAPDFKYVATHICDSLKQRLKKEGVKNIQGEFGIGLLSFWTVGHKLTIVSSGKDGKTYQMEMEKSKPGYKITNRYRLMPVAGTQLIIRPLLAGVRSLSGEKIQRYLASELRDRIRKSNIKIKIIDRRARNEFAVEPRQYSGQLLHKLPVIATSFGDIYAELYLNQKREENQISLFRSGTRLINDITDLEFFAKEPWASGYFEGIIDTSFLHLTPGTRGGVIQDDRYSAFCQALAPLEEQLTTIAFEQQRAEEERMSRNLLRTVQKAFREAMYALPQEEYDWFEVYRKNKTSNHQPQQVSSFGQNNVMIAGKEEILVKKDKQKAFFEFAGPLFSAQIRPGSALVEIGKSKSFRALGIDRSKRQIEENLSFIWVIAEGGGRLDKNKEEIAVFNAPQEPGLSKLKVVVSQGAIKREAEGVVTVVDSLVKPLPNKQRPHEKGLPAYTLESAPGQTWRSRYDTKRNIIIVNSGHRDFVYAGKQKTRKLRYICRLFAKELVYHNFIGASPEQLLERMVELSLYTEENLR